MHYTFLSAHSVQGITHPSGEADITLFEDQTKGIRVLLTADAVRHLHLLNRHLAIMSMMLRAMVGNPLTAEFPNQLVAETAKVESQRRDSIGSDPVVIIEITGSVKAQLSANVREVQDFLLCFDAFDKKALKARLQSEVSAVLTALRTGTGAQLEFRQVCDGSYLLTDDGKVVHSVSVEMGSFGVYVSKRLTQDQQAQVEADISLALKAGPLERVMRLHAQSLNKETDNYRAFVAAWAALEMLIGKLFPTYQRLLIAELRAVNQSPGLHTYLDRIENVMGDKHNLAAKFAVLSAYLDDDRTEDEVRIFRELKGVRDRLSHGEELEESSLPTRDIQRLFEKYLRNHFRRDA
jgi:hypothetical protein